MRHTVVHAPLFGARGRRSTSILDKLNRDGFELGTACPEKESSAVMRERRLMAERP